MGAQMTPFKMAVGDMTMQMDVNSMKELDLLSHPQSVIKEAQELAAKAIQCRSSLFLGERHDSWHTSDDHERCGTERYNLGSPQLP